jgi:hypothetical protein
MTRDDIIRFGEQADEVADRKIRMRGEFHPDWHEVRDEAFAAVVAAAEREACARIANSYGGPKEPMMVGQMEAGAYNTAEAIAADIRARGEQPKRHPGYIVGDHWLQAAYTRICTGETEAEVMADYGWQRESR